VGVGLSVGITVPQADNDKLRKESSMA